METGVLALASEPLGPPCFCPTVWLQAHVIMTNFFFFLSVGARDLNPGLPHTQQALDPLIHLSSPSFYVIVPALPSWWFLTLLNEGTRKQV